MHWLELKIPPVALVIVVAFSMWAVSIGLPDLRFDFPWATPIAVGIALVGILVAMLGVMEFRSAGTTVDPRVPDQAVSLVVRGIYRFSRNPMYVGFLLVLCAWGLFLGNWAGLVFLPFFVVYMNRFQIAPEERQMREKFGEAYIQYTAQVRRWI